MSDLNPGDWDPPAATPTVRTDPMCFPHDPDATPEDVTARNAPGGTGPGRPSRAGCASGSWLDSAEGRMWESFAGSRRRPDPDA